MIEKLPPPGSCQPAPDQPLDLGPVEKALLPQSSIFSGASVIQPLVQSSRSTSASFETAVGDLKAWLQ
ncbi:MAG: hypothetical protein R3D81_11005 [Thalassovita sp.]